MIYEHAATAPPSPQSYKSDDGHVDTGVDTAVVDTGVDIARSTPEATHSESLYSDKDSSDGDAGGVSSNQASDKQTNDARPSAHSQADMVTASIKAVGNWEIQQRQV